MLTSTQLVQLKTEITTDPNGRGYAPLVASGDDTGLAAALNLPRTGANGGAAITFRRANISSQELVEAILVADYSPLQSNPTAAQLSTERRYLAWLGALVAAPMVRLQTDAGADTPVLTNLAAMFPAGSSTRNRIVTLINRFGSVAESLFGQGVIVNELDVALAKAA